MKVFVALQLLMTVTLPAKVAAARAESERGSETIEKAIIAAAMAAAAIALGAVLVTTITTYANQIH